MELLRNVLTGWTSMNTNGKYVVLLLAALLWLWLGLKGRTQTHRWLLAYGTLITALVLFPVTGAGLMVYQTRFYDYSWLWSLVPLSMVIAWGGAAVWGQLYQERWRGGRLLPVCWGAFGLAVLVLCGNLGGFQTDSEEQALNREKASRALVYLTEYGKNSNICLWAPRELMEQVRALSGDVLLVYGRNMWEDTLKGYTYDTYASEVEALYEWMEELGLRSDEQKSFTQEQLVQQAAGQVEAALAQGVNTIVLPEETPEEIQESLLETLQGSGRQVLMDGVEWEDYLIYQIE